MDNQMPVYKDPEKSVSERCEDLIARMTLEEKLAQLVSRWHHMFFAEEIFESAAAAYLKDGLGTVSWLLPNLQPEDNAKVLNKIQKYAMENTRLGIPVIFHGEALAGGLFYGASYFPTAIGLASTWEPELIQCMTTAIREQMYEYGVRIVFSPVLDIARDPRWGRIAETYGEDPYLACQMGKSFVDGMQGGDLTKGIACTGKHFLGYAAGEGGRNKEVAGIGKRELYEIYARPFEAVIKDSGVKAMMNSYGVIDNVPIPGSREILTGLLKEELGFDGVVVSDYGSVSQLHVINRSARDKEEAAVQALSAGIDIEQPEPDMYPYLNDAVEKGAISLDLIDTAVRKVLALKFQLGLFENPYAPGKVMEKVNKKENKALARKISAKSMVLLKNENNLLPLSVELSSIAVVGPNADHIRCFFGGYSSVALRELSPDCLTAVMGTDNEIDFTKEHPTLKIYLEQMGIKMNEDTTDEEKQKIRERFNEFLQSIKSSFVSFGDETKIDGFARYFHSDSASVLEAIRKNVSDKTVVNFAKGCDITGTSTEGFAEAVEAVKKSEAAVVVLGGIEGMGKGTTCGEGKDSTDIVLPGVQQQLLEELHKTGKPIVLVLINSRPISVPWAAQNIPAILQAWTPGEAGGYAIADTLLGLAAPGGKLPVTILRNVGQFPMYYNRKPVYTDINSYGEYIDHNDRPLYPFGHGLSYTEFSYDDLTFKENKVDSQGAVTLSFKLTNTGSRAGEEVAQVYFRDREANVVRPVKELVGFKRVPLEPGESRTLEFTVDTRQLGYYDRDMNFVVEPGHMDVFVGSSSEDIRLTGEFEITGSAVDIKGRRVFSSKVRIL